jgi:uncharacterized phiE125 gp8 family phage protein
MSLKINRTISGSEPITLGEAKAYNRVLFNAEDATIELLIEQARQTLEQATNLSLVEQTIELVNDNYKDSFRLPYGPVQTVTTCQLDGHDIAAAYITANGRIIYKGSGTLTVEYEAGGVTYEGLRIAMLELVAFLFMNRGTSNDLPQTVKRWILNNTLNSIA